MPKILLEGYIERLMEGRHAAVNANKMRIVSVKVENSALKQHVLDIVTIKDGEHIGGARQGVSTAS